VSVQVQSKYVLT